MPSISELYSFSAPMYSPADQQRQHEKNQHSQAIYQFAKTCVANKCTLTPDRLSIRKTPQGKPYFTETNSWHISLSHNKEYSILLIANDPCAVDTELCLPRTYEERLAAKLGRYFNYPANTQTLYPLWTLLEAWCKLHNQTLWQTLQVPNPLPAQIIDEYLNADSVYHAPYLICKLKPTSNSLVCTVTKLTQPPTQGIPLAPRTIIAATY